MSRYTVVTQAYKHINLATWATPDMAMRDAQKRSRGSSVFHLVFDRAATKPRLHAVFENGCAVDFRTCDACVGSGCGKPTPMAVPGCEECEGRGWRRRA